MLPSGPPATICALPRPHLRFLLVMNNADLRCDGCEQPASPEHIARRLQRLEWTTRYRPVHIGTLLLGAVAPRNDSEFIYCPAGKWNGEAQLLLSAAGLVLDGKSAESVLAEFQRGGFFVTHVLECPLEGGGGSGAEKARPNFDVIKAVPSGFRFRRTALPNLARPRCAIRVRRGFCQRIRQALARSIGWPGSFHPVGLCLRLLSKIATLR